MSNIFGGSLFILNVLVFFHALNADAQESQSAQQVNQTKIFVDPDVRVSYDGDVVHMETYVSASATDPDLLIAGGEVMVPGRRLNASEARIYRSTDGGARWSPTLLPDEVNGGWDIVSSLGANAYFITNNFDKGLTVYRTNDGGLTWNPTILSNAIGWDRPQAAVDVTESPYRGGSMWPVKLTWVSA
jgi:hypothetical protein